MESALTETTNTPATADRDGREPTARQISMNVHLILALTALASMESTTTTAPANQDTQDATAKQISTSVLPVLVYVAFAKI